MRSICTLPLLALAIVALSGCRRDMIDQPRYEAFEANDFFPDHSASRPLPEHTIARGQLQEDSHLYRARVGGELVVTLPAPITPESLERGRQRYEIYCAVCHGATGDGRGMIVERGFPPPPSFHTDRLRDAPVGHFFEVITNGFGLMYPYASRVEPADRWAIIGYIRALQLSQNARLADAEPTVRGELERSLK